MSNNVVLRKLTTEDINLFAKWIEKPYVNRWYKETEEWLDEVKNREGKFSFVKHFIAVKDNRDIGFCQYYDYSLGGEEWHNGTDIENTYSIDYLIGEEEYLGKRLGPAIIHALEREMLKENNIKKIIVQPERENLISRKTLLSAGYEYDKENDIFVKLF